MGFSLNGRYLGDTPSEALANMSRKEISDLAYYYITRYFDIEDVAETIANNRESSVDWAEDALSSLVEYARADGFAELEDFEYRRGSKPNGSRNVKSTGTAKTASKKKSAPKKPAQRRR